MHGHFVAVYCHGYNTDPAVDGTHLHGIHLEADWLTSLQEFFERLMHFREEDRLSSASLSWWTA